MSTKHTLSVLVENKPGVLARISALFSRRGFNIDSLAVGPTEHDEISRMTVVVDVEDLPLEQVTKQLNKLVEVLKVVELEPGASVQREVLLIKVRCDNGARAQVLQARNTARLLRTQAPELPILAVLYELPLELSRDGGWRTRAVPLRQRPPAITQPGYPAGAR